jgi:Fe-S cluster assembly iron-binding protein IscA
MKYKYLLLYVFFIVILHGCTSNLSVFEIEDRINEYNTAMSKDDIDYEISNLPKKYLSNIEISSVKEKIQKIYDRTEYPKVYSNIGELEILKEGKCNSFYFYKVKYKVTVAQMTPYLDSSALKYNYSKYGKENVSFKEKSKILHITKNDEKILIHDKDKNWKILNIYKESLNKYFGNDFFSCIN